MYKKNNQRFAAVVKSAYILAGLSLCICGGVMFADGVQDRKVQKETGIKSTNILEPTAKKVLGGAAVVLGLELFSIIGTVITQERQSRRKYPMVK
jgi:hypothetical protein